MKKIIPILIAVLLLSGCKIVRSIGETIGVVKPVDTTEVIITPNPEPITSPLPKMNYTRLVLIFGVLVVVLVGVRYALKKSYAKIGQTDDDES